jgi:hypothetical protein
MIQQYNDILNCASFIQFLKLHLLNLGPTIGFRIARPMDRGCQLANRRNRFKASNVNAEASPPLLQRKVGGAACFRFNMLSYLK